MSNSSNIIQKNRVYAPVVVGIALLVIVFVLYPIYTKYVDASATIHALEITRSEKQTKVDEIKNMQALFAPGNTKNDLAQKVKKYSQSLDTATIMEQVMINKFTEGTKFNPAPIRIASINVGKGAKLPSGLSLATTSLALSADSVDSIVDYLTYLTTDSPLAFTIDNISLPLDTNPTSSVTGTTGVSLAITLGVYYYDTPAK